MSPSSPFARSDFIPEFADYAAFAGHTLGLTGARGVLGRLLVERLSQHGIACAEFPGDVNQEAALADWFADRQFRHFFHFAALVPVAEVEANPLLAYQTNVIGTFNVCKQFVRTQTDCWFFHCSSSHVYQPACSPVPISEQALTCPPTFYGATKLAAERLVDTLLGKLRVRYCIGRVFSFTHPRQAPPYLVPSLQRNIAALRDDDTLEVSNPSAVRDIQDAGQVIDVMLQLARHGALGTVNIGTGAGLSVKDIALAVARLQGRRITVTGVDRDLPAALIADTTRLRSLLAPAAT